MAKNPKKQKEYFEELGRFVNAFSNAESIIHISFKTFAGIDSQVAGIVKSNMRVSDIISAIRKIVIIKRLDKENASEINSIFDQFTHIANFRNNVLHRGAALAEDDTFYSTNVATTNIFSGIEVANFKIEDIQNATSDLQRILFRITKVSRCLPNGIPFDPWDKYDAKDLFAPWLYIPVKPRKLGQQNSSTDRKHSPPKKSSHR